MLLLPWVPVSSRVYLHSALISIPPSPWKPFVLMVSRTLLAPNFLGHPTAYYPVSFLSGQFNFFFF